jgi:hypothetical protein
MVFKINLNPKFYKQSLADMLIIVSKIWIIPTDVNTIIFVIYLTDSSVYFDNNLDYMQFWSEISFDYANKMLLLPYKDAY